MRQQEFNNSVYGDVAGRDIVNHTTVQIAQQTVVHHHHSAPPAQLAQQAPLAPPAPPMTLGQKKLLALMKPLGKDARVKVLDYMREHFGTGMVRELSPTGLAKTHLHVLALSRDGAPVLEDAAL